MGTKKDDFLAIKLLPEKRDIFSYTPGRIELIGGFILDAFVIFTILCLYS